jgi:hypothetical protein
MRTIAPGLLALVFGMVACGGGPGAPRASGDDGRTRDGSRLKARWLEAPGGLRQFSGWYDSQLQLHCSFLIAADGELRCLPVGISTAAGPTAADPTCTAPAIIVAGGECRTPAQPYLLQAKRQPGACQARYQVFRRGERLTVRYERPMGVCTPEPLPQQSVGYGLGEELPPVMFVKGKLVAKPLPPAGDPLQLMAVEAEDGATDTVSWKDVARDLPCSPVRTEGDRFRCLPFGALAQSATYAEETCMRPAVVLDQACPEHGMVMRRPVAGSCPLSWEVIAAGTEVESSFLVRAGACTRSPPTTTRYFELGPVLAADQFPAFDFVDLPSSQRLQRRVVTSPGGQQMTVGWFDTERQHACNVVVLGDKYVCTPPTTSAETFYVDDRCATPVLHTLRDTCIPASFVFGYDRTTCPWRVTFNSIGPPYTGAVYISLLYDITGVPAPSTCRPYTPRPGDVFRTLIPVPDGSLPELKPVEPM